MCDSPRGCKRLSTVHFIGKSLESITLPSTIVEIDSHAFQSCYNLREVTLNDGLQKIGDNAFSECTSLENVKLLPTLVEISAGAFECCCNLKEVELNDGLQKIGDGAFYKCSSLESIKLPSTVTEIGYSTFNTKHARTISLLSRLPCQIQKRELCFT